MIRPQQRQRQRLCFSTYLCLFILIAYSNAFSTPASRITSTSSTSPLTVLSESSTQEDQQPDGIWLPQLRRVMGGIASAGALETGYLTVNKLTQQSTSSLPFCGVDGGGCNDILNGPYSYVPFTEIPLSALGFLAYCAVAGLALLPLNSDNKDDSENRVALTALTTTMATFSIFLMTLLFGVLQTSCPYCVFSAACSIILAKLAWIGGCLPEGNKSGIRLATSGFLASTVTAVLLFVSGTESQIGTNINNSAATSWGGGTLLASTATGKTPTQSLAPPPITTESSTEAIALASTLETMNAKMYGAYWCSHCYDQKETLGKQAFSKIEYVECSKDGVNSKTKLCRAMEVPGYPTWEIDGELYPGQLELDELQDLVKDIKAGKALLK